MDTAGVLDRARRLRKEGRVEEALVTLRDGLSRGGLSAEDTEAAGRLIRRCLAEREKVGSVLLLGQCTTSFLANTLTATAWADGMLLDVRDGEYDNVLQDLSLLESPVDTLVLLPWNQRLFSDRSSAGERVEAEVGFWRQVWDLARKKGISRVVQVGYDYVTASSLGEHLDQRKDGHKWLVREVNERLRASLTSGYFVDLEATSGEHGRRGFYEPRQYYWTKQPFSSQGLVALSTQIAAGIRAMSSGPKKVLVLDLDNTLWGGVVGELGPKGVQLGDSPDGEAFRAFQKYVKGLKERGVVLAVASKNNDADAREPFDVNPEMVLKLGDIAAFEASWEPKAQALARIAKQLSLSLDSFVFFDDNPAEREHIRQALPMVGVVEVREDPAEYVRALSASAFFETTAVSKEDLERGEQYAVERHRKELAESFASLDDYLKSLEMTADFRPIDENDLQRVVQLIGKTNQFNLTTRRHGVEQVRALVADPRSVHVTFRLRDKFGDYGLVGVVIGAPDAQRDEKDLRIDTWLMSCRVIGRTAEHATLAQVGRMAEALGYTGVVGEYLPTPKNDLVSRLYDELGFERVAITDNGTVRYHARLPLRPLPTFVAVEADHK